MCIRDRLNTLYEVFVRQAKCLLPTSFRSHLTIDTLAIGYAIPAIRIHSGLASVRQYQQTESADKPPLPVFFSRQELHAISTFLPPRFWKEIIHKKI